MSVVVILAASFVVEGLVWLVQVESVFDYLPEGVARFLLPMTYFSLVAGISTAAFILLI